MNLRKLFRQSTGSAVWYGLVVVLLPVISLCVLGLIYLWQQNQLLWVLLGWLAITLAGYAIYSLWPARQTTDHRSGQQGSDSSLPDTLDARAYWTEQDLLIWKSSCATIESRLAEGIHWDQLPQHSVMLLSEVSSHYRQGAVPNADTHQPVKGLEYRFTLPEALLVLSVASNRYRDIILRHIPFAESVTVSSLITLYERQHEIQTGFTWFNRARRTLRLANPLGAVIGELKDQFTNRVFDQLSDNVQTDLKRLLLQEVAQVGIDLYSGKLKSSSQEMQAYRSAAFQEDQQRESIALEPIRVILVGQTSAGKSSLINALSDTLQAETDILPTTDAVQIHAMTLEAAHPIHLVDTVGLDGSASRVDELTRLAADADLIVFLARANQPARAPDQQLHEALTARFDAQPNRRLPPIMLVVTHVDQLSPRNQWDPPYDLNSDDRKAATMAAALASCTEQIGLGPSVPVIPVCLSKDKGYYNVEAVAAQLMLLQDEATLSQWNRRRVERGQHSISWGERWGQVKRLGLVIGKAAIK